MKRDVVVHAFATLKTGWAEEITEKLKPCQDLPLILGGLWPPDDGARVIAERVMELWGGIERQGLIERQQRVTLDFCLPGRVSTLAMQLRAFAQGGGQSVELALRAKELNITQTHSQRVEGLHAIYKQLDFQVGRPCAVPVLASKMSLPRNLQLVKASH